MKDQPHAYGSNEEADDAGSCIDAVRADVACDRVGVGEDEKGCDHGKKDRSDYRGQ